MFRNIETGVVVWSLPIENSPAEGVIFADDGRVIAIGMGGYYHLYPGGMWRSAKSVSTAMRPTAI